MSAPSALGIAPIRPSRTTIRNPTSTPENVRGREMAVRSRSRPGNRSRASTHAGPSERATDTTAAVHLIDQLDTEIAACEREIRRAEQLGVCGPNATVLGRTQAGVVYGYSGASFLNGSTTAANSGCTLFPGFAVAAKGWCKAYAPA